MYMDVLKGTKTKISQEQTHGGKTVLAPSKILPETLYIYKNNTVDSRSLLRLS